MNDGKNYKVKKMDRSDIKNFVNKFQSTHNSNKWKVNSILTNPEEAYCRSEPSQRHFQNEYKQS
jgi:hypothetical protein